ncbi:hypothetical protein PG985_001485 [Apiospora marii]|uniref:Uncharacterized protein n=1 Tax=Apiospora marii TaxID=335849 RepID=A0ABR1RI43_9PEZI
MGYYDDYNDYDGSGDTGGDGWGDGDGMDQGGYGIIPDEVATNPAYGDVGIDPNLTMLPDSGMSYPHASSSSSYGVAQNGVAPQ